MSAEVCTIPPMGWICTRVGGHDGPCAAEPVVQLELRDKLMIELAYCRHIGLPVSETVDRLLREIKLFGETVDA